MDLFKLEPERYFSWPSTYTKERRDEQLERMIEGGKYIWSEKTDGNYARFVCQNGVSKIQTRGIAVGTGEFGEVQDKVFFFNALKQLFPQDSLVIGEIYLPGKIDKDVGAILRCKAPKAIERQTESQAPVRFRIFDIWYYNGKSLMETKMIDRVALLAELSKKNTNPLISFVTYYKLDKNFYDHLFKILSSGGEGAVLTSINKLPLPGKRKSWETLKIKQELQQEIDCFISGLEGPTRAYTGGDVGSWQYWENLRTGELMMGDHFSEYRLGQANFEPVTKNYFNGWPGAIICSVFDDDNSPYELCRVAGLTDSMKEELKNNYSEYHMMPIKISGMSISLSEGRYSVRHPKLISLREGDIRLEDCSLKKIIQ